MAIVKPSGELLRLLTFLICLLHHSNAGYDVESVLGARSLLSANLKLVGGTTEFGPDVKRLDLTARQRRIADSTCASPMPTIHDERSPKTSSPRPTSVLEDVLLGSPDMDNATLPSSATISKVSSDLTFSIHTNPFRYTVSRRSTGDILSDTSPTLIFKDRYLEVTTALPAGRASLYGFGEHTKRTFRLQPNDTFTLWNEDLERSDQLDRNLYGSHPFYMDFIGRPAPMPYWSFGFHQCRYGYKNVADLEEVVAGYAKAKIPLEGIWSDIDYMDGGQDFTLDPINFPASHLRPFVDRLHSNGQKYVVIIDPEIKRQATPNEDFFLKRNGTNVVGRVWPGEVYFPDFINPRAVEYWAQKISEFRRTIPVDGLWCDMNEPSNFGAWQPLNALDDPPYHINNSGTHRPLNNQTVPVSTVHYNGVSEYDAHNLFGLFEARATHAALLKDTARRPFMLSRSTFPGAGRYAAHWTGDNSARWDELANSINTMLSFGLFGIPMVGADLCGFRGNTSQELCSRWIQLGAFYPFARAHMERTTERRELYVWESTAQSARKAFGTRYRMLPYMYTLMYEAHTTGAPIARPLFFSYPQDADTYGVDKQFLLGRGVLVSPVLQPGATTVDAYFPAGRWFSLYDHNYPLTVATRTGKRVTLQAPVDSANNDTASGELFLDDGESMEMGGVGGKWTLVKFSCSTEESKGIITTTVSSHVVQNSYVLSRAQVIGNMVFMGLQSPAKGFTIYVNNVELKAARTKSRTSGAFSVSGLSLAIGKEFQIKVVMSH
ncbi:hypothetical protein VPH35_024558 [Triticum aestivum]|uniref:Alpha-glucosidase n=1 Tax=Triticum aestivum TaxID=4565 RepID=A0A3B6B8J1_WHEAT